MPITRDDIRRKINFGTDMKTQKHAQGSAGIKLGLRSKPPKGMNSNTEQFRLDRLTTGEFDKLIGEGPDPEVVQEKKKLSKQKKTEENLRLENMCELNNRVLQEGEVRNDLLKEANDGTTQDGELDKTEPLVDPTDVVSDDASGSNPEEAKQSDKSKQSENPGQEGSDILKNHHQSQTINVKQYSDMAVQTKPVTVVCLCARCEAIYSGLRQIVNAANNSDCHLCSNSEEASKSPASLNILTAVGGNMKHDAPLYLGSTIMLTSTDKSMLKDLSPSDDDPKEFVHLIMDSIYTPEQMANMSAMGRTAGSTKMDPSIFKQMFAYMRHKFKGQEDVVFNKSLMVKIINAKCYSMRRQCWEKMRRGDCDSETSLLVRKALPKKTRDVNKPPKNPTRKRKEPASPQNCGESRSERKKRRKHEQNPTGNEKHDTQTSRKKDKNKREINEKDKIVIRGSGEKDKSVIRGSHEKDKALTPRSRDKDKTLTRRSSETDKKDRRSNSQNDKSEKHSSSDKAKIEKYRNNETDIKNQKRGSGDQRGHMRLFQRDSLKRNSVALSPRKRTPKKNGGESRHNSFEVSPSQNDKVSTSTPKFGGKRPKSLEQLLQMNRALEDYDDDEEDEEMEMNYEDNEESDESEAETIHSSESDSEAIHTD